MPHNIELQCLTCLIRVQSWRQATEADYQNLSGHLSTDILIVLPEAGNVWGVKNQEATS